MDVLLSQWRGRAIILLNAEWTVETVDPQFKAFVKSFDSVYSFLPLAIQVSHALPCTNPCTKCTEHVHVSCMHMAP